MIQAALFFSCYDLDRKKEHPGNTRGLFESGIAGAEKFPNVLILKKESIVDCIAVSDFWITYESTTVIEAWLLGKQTCLLNPTGIDFPRANVYKGSPNYPDVPTLQAAIDSFYSTHELPSFQATLNDHTGNSCLQGFGEVHTISESKSSF